MPKRYKDLLRTVRHDRPHRLFKVTTDQSCQKIAILLRLTTLITMRQLATEEVANKDNSQEIDQKDESFFRTVGHDEYFGLQE